MNGMFCIDKRIGYLALFAVPLIMLTIFSFIVNSQKVTQNSRAFEPVVVSLTPKVTPTTIPMSYVCFVKKNMGGVVISKGTVNTNLVMRVYDNKMNLLTLLDKLPINLPISLREDAYIGIQGQVVDPASIMGQCSQL